MPNWERPLWAAAQQMTTLLDPPAPPEPGLSVETLQDVQRLQRLWDYAADQGWERAAIRVRAQLCHRAHALLRELQFLVAEPPLRPDLARATAGDVYRDLVALRNEFPAMEIDIAEQTVAVTTERIVLDEIDLGPFELIWSWGLAGEEEELRVVAQQPKPAAGREDITHPHVRDDLLCLGAAQTTLRRALRAGRLFDAFLVVRQVLQTYNAGSAYDRQKHSHDSVRPEINALPLGNGTLSSVADSIS